ncbi:hypothetical protein [Streptomyces albidoflavus]|uniref:hypothetical protein n=1 Tax=Streptomyces albidoflavus TaxID=1886 RepID=UPI001A923DB0|nr:hypothetical protein [Streptomyces albidoflavus]
MGVEHRLDERFGAARGLVAEGEWLGDVTCRSSDRVASRSGAPFGATSRPPPSSSSWRNISSNMPRRSRA